MNTEETELISIIKEYIACANYCLGIFKTIYNGPDNILYAWKVKKKFDREGVIENMHYSFHGRGCYIQIAGLEIDIDFSFNGQRVDGFDLYRLSLFAKQKKASLDEEAFGRAFHNLIKKGYLIKDPDEPTGHLYYYEKSR